MTAQTDANKLTFSGDTSESRMRLRDTRADDKSGGQQQQQMRTPTPTRFLPKRTCRAFYPRWASFEHGP
eukprot:5903575-Pyramimonas_sp.AAC.1